MTFRRLLALVVALGVLLGAGGIRGAGAQDTTSSSTTTTSVVVELPDDGIIPRPNSGRAPEEAGDRGGALQLLVLGLVLAAVGGGVALVVRDARRSRS